LTLRLTLASERVERYGNVIDKVTNFNYLTSQVTLRLTLARARGESA